jgi:hypothetical protein
MKLRRIEDLEEELVEQKEKNEMLEKKILHLENFIKQKFSDYEEDMQKLSLSLSLPLSMITSHILHDNCSCEEVSLNYSLQDVTRDVFVVCSECKIRESMNFDNDEMMDEHYTQQNMENIQTMRCIFYAVHNNHPYCLRHIYDKQRKSALEDGKVELKFYNNENLSKLIEQCKLNKKFSLARIIEKRWKQIF